MKKSADRFDFLSPPVLLGAVYVVLFGWAPLAQGVGEFRLVEVFRDYRGVSASALVYLWLGYALFVLGYNWRMGQMIARKLPIGSLSFKPLETSIITAVLFGVSFGIVCWLAQRYQVSRLIEFAGDGGDIDTRLNYLFTVGDLTLMAYALGVWRFMLSRRPGGLNMPRNAVLFLWGVMLPLLIMLLLFWASRSKIGYFFLITMLAYHHGYRRLRARYVVLGGLVIFVLVMPIIAYIRVAQLDKLSLDSVLLGLTWLKISVMQRTTSLQGFTVTFENLQSVPVPDPPWMVLTSGIIPRVLWPSKPISDFDVRFSDWASGQPFATLTPSLPGELLLHFGYVGGLAAMLALGIFWRTAFCVLVGHKERPFTSGFIYIFLLSLNMQVIEGGFVIGYGGLLRFLLISMIIYRVVRGPRARVFRMINAQKRLAMRF